MLPDLPNLQNKDKDEILDYVACDVIPVIDRNIVNNSNLTDRNDNDNEP